MHAERIEQQLIHHFSGDELTFSDDGFGAVGHLVRVLGNLLLLFLVAFWERISGIGIDLFLEGLDEFLVGEARCVGILVKGRRFAPFTRGFGELVKKGVERLDGREVRLVDWRPGEAEEGQLRNELDELRILEHVEVAGSLELVRRVQIDQPDEGGDLFFVEQGGVRVVLPQHLCDLSLVDRVSLGAQIVEILLAFGAVALVCISSEEEFPDFRILLHELDDELSVAILLVVDVDERNVAVDWILELSGGRHGVFGSLSLIIVNEGLDLLLDAALILMDSLLNPPLLQSVLQSLLLKGLLLQGRLMLDVFLLDFVSFEFLDGL